jgi:phosphoketolase
MPANGGLLLADLPLPSKADYAVKVEHPGATHALSSHVRRQDHNGFSHQDPGFIDVVANKNAGVIRVYLPPDANTLLCVAETCLRSRNLVNVIIAGKQPEPQWLDMDAALKHCATGIGIFEFASNDTDGDPDVVMACAGDVPTMGGFKEEGTTTTPFDMVVRNDLDRFHLVMEVIDRVPKLGYRAAHLRQLKRDKLTEHAGYITQRGEDMPEVRDWVWQDSRDESRE